MLSLAAWLPAFLRIMQLLLVTAAGLLLLAMLPTSKLHCTRSDWSHDFTPSPCAVAEAIGVVAEPELTSTKLQPDHAFMVVASDGIWEFLPSQRVVDMVAAFPTPEEAAKVLVAAAYKAWLQKETRTDDISIIVMHFDHAPKE